MAGAGARTRKDGTASAKVGSVERLTPRTLGPGMPTMREVRTLGAAAEAGPRTGKRAEDLAARAQSARAARTAFMAARRGERERVGAAVKSAPDPSISFKMGDKIAYTPASVNFIKGVYFLVPARKSMGEPVAVKSLMPPGARVVIPGQGEGKIEYAPGHSGYVRYHAGMGHENPAIVARKLISAGAVIHHGPAAPPVTAAAASGVKAVPSPDARAAHRAEHQAKLDAAEARVMGQGIAKPGAPATKGPTPLQAHKIETLADFHHQRATRGDVSSAADRSEMPAHALAARVYREAAKGGDVNAALHKADAEWRAHAAKVSADIKAAPKTKMGPYSGQSVMRDHWANPDKFSHMAPEIRANVARELAAQHAPMAEARHAAWKIGEAQKWAAISKADRAQHEAGMNPTAGTKLAAAAAHREAAAAMRSAPEQHAPDHPMHAREKARVEEHAKWREEHATKLEAEAHAGKQKAAADSAAAKVAKEERRADRAKVAAGKTARATAEQALRGGPALNAPGSKTIRLTTSDGKGIEAPVLARHGDFVLHRPASSMGVNEKGFTVSHAPSGLSVGSLANYVKNKTEGKAVLASLNHPEFKKAFDAFNAAPESGKRAAGKNIMETWNKVKPVLGATHAVQKLLRSATP